MAGSMRFGKFLRHHRTGQGWTLEALAKKCKSSKGYLSGIENGKVSPPKDGIARLIAKALGLEESIFLALAKLEQTPGCVRMLLDGECEKAIARGYAGVIKPPAAPPVSIATEVSTA